MPTLLEPETIAPDALRSAAIHVLPTPPKVRREDPAFLDHLKKVNDTFYDQIRIADQKAAYIFTFMVAFLVTAEARAVFGVARYQSGDWGLIAVSAVLALSMLTALVAAILTVLPRNRATGTSLYWNAWASNRAAFLGALEGEEPNWLFHQYLSNVDALAAIARKKYATVSWAFRALVVAAITFCVLMGQGA